MLSKADILKADDLRKESVTVPEWGGDVFVRTMTGSERDYYEDVVRAWLDDKKKAKSKDIRATLAALTVCDEAGKRLFTEAETEQLGKKSYLALDRITEVAYRLNFPGEKKG